MSIDISVTCNPVEVNVTDDIIEISQVGLQGPQGPAGPGIPQGGTTGQILAKIDGTNYNTEWIDNYTTDIRENIKAGEAINKGQAVYISGADGTNIIVRKASNSTESTSSKTIGLLAQNLANNGQGFVITEGKLSGLNTTGAVVGDPVWLGVNGNLLYGAANKPVAPANLVYLGVVTRVNANNGEIFIHVINGFELEELHNVKITNPTNGEVLKYNSTTGLWENGVDASSNIYNSDGTLTGNRTVTMGFYTLSFDKDISVNGVKVGIGPGSYNSNIRFGNSSLLSNQTGTFNTAIGYNSLSSNTVGYSNTSLGSNALRYTTTGYSNTALGDGALNNNTTGYENEAIGNFALINNTSGFVNVALGTFALGQNRTGYYNIGIGRDAGSYVNGFGSLNETSNNSIYLGYLTTSAASGSTNEIVIGSQTQGNGSNTVTLGNNSITATYLKGILNASNLSGTGTRMVVANASGVLSTQAIPTGNPGTVTSVGLTSATTGLTITNTPITSSGNINLEIATASGSQNGLLSSTDWTTFNNKQNALTNPITGTGASGQVAYWNGTNTQTGSNNLFWDAANNRLRLGGAADTGQRLQINGDTLLKGSGNTSGTTALTVQNSSGTTILSVRNDNYVLSTNFSTTNIFANNYYSSGSGNALNLFGGTTGTSVSYVFNSNGSSDSAISNDFVRISRTYNPTSGTGIYNILFLGPTINQTGGANGITRGLYINPTLTAAANWRSIETSNNTGWAAYFAGSADLFFNDATDLQFGTTTGTKIGTATTQKIGFYGATPVSQLTTAVSSATAVENTGILTINENSTFGGYTIGQIVQALKNMGILA